MSASRDEHPSGQAEFSHPEEVVREIAVGTLRVLDEVGLPTPILMWADGDLTLLATPECDAVEDYQDKVTMAVAAAMLELGLEVQ